MNKEDVKKGYLAAMATMEVSPQDAEQYWESYEGSQHWSVKNHSDLSIVSGSYIYLVHDCDRSSVLSAHLTEESAEQEVTEFRKGYAPSVTFDIQKVEVK